MITERIQNLFQFIEFLNLNIENFKQYNELIDELYLLLAKLNEFNPHKNFVEKLKYDEVGAEIDIKFNVINENLIKVTQAKAAELNIYDINRLETLRNWNRSEIDNLTKNFSEEDISEILQHKSKYLEFRTKTNCDYFQSHFFQDLDKILKVLFDFFKESTENEFEAFETKAIPVNSFREVFELSQVYQNSPETFPSQQPETKPEQETIEIKPVLKPEAVQIVFDILKDFFSTEQQDELKLILKTGNNATTKLLFKDNANRLTDTFKKLIEHNFITGCQKQDLEKWIITNFLFLHNGVVKVFKTDVVNKYVSGSEYATGGCKSPLIEIENGQILKVEKPRRRKQK